MTKYFFFQLRQIALFMPRDIYSALLNKTNKTTKRNVLLLCSTGCIRVRLNLVSIAVLESLLPIFRLVRFDFQRLLSRLVFFDFFFLYSDLHESVRCTACVGVDPSIHVARGATRGTKRELPSQVVLLLFAIAPSCLMNN